jgi:hypothetical protein
MWGMGQREDAVCCHLAHFSSPAIQGLVEGKKWTKPKIWVANFGRKLFRFKLKCFFENELK